MTTRIDLFKTIVGSHAHGLAGPDSDIDYRGVFVQPTRELLAIGPKAATSSWIEGQEDDTSYEVGHFLFLATKSNPSILEVFRAPLAPAPPWTVPPTGLAFYQPTYAPLLIENLFPHVWSSQGVRDAFMGYGRNQRTKLFSDKPQDAGRRHKYAVAWLRTLYNAHCLLTTGTFDMDVIGTPVEPTLRTWKAGRGIYGTEKYPVPMTVHEVIQVCQEWEQRVQEAYEANPDKRTEVEPVNDALLRIRKDFW